MIGASTLVTAPAADAQQLRWGRPTVPTSGACFYRNPNFGGTYFCAAAGDDIAFLSGGMNNQVSSIRTFGDAEVTIFQEPRFRGRWTRVEDDVRNLRREGWNDQLSSVRISSGYRRRGHDPYRRYGSLGRIETREWQDDRGDRRDGSDSRRYDPNDRRDGTVGGRRPGENADAVVRRLYQDVLHRAPDAQGLALYRNRMNNENWSEQDVREALLESPEYRQRANTMDPRASATNQQDAEGIVARAYRSVLNREPDPGSRVYVEKVLRERWTEADVVRDLRNSPEYRARIR